MTALLKFLSENKIEYLINEAMSRHTTFRIGGNADVFIMPKRFDEILGIINVCNKENIPFTVIGKGSNLVVSDKGIEGAVICTQQMNKITLLQNGEVTADCGVSLASLCTFARDNGLSGLEFAYGIPGSVGGAIFMNAGAYGGEMKDVAVKAQALIDGEIKEISAEDMRLSYRKSIFKEKDYIVLSLTVALKQDEKENITARMDDYMNRRKTKQPLEYPSAGSVFKRPEGYFAGALIEENGFKGYSIGGAQVSEKHAGFIINKGGATCDDVKALVLEIQDKIFKTNNVKMETELIFKGRE